MSNNSPRLCVKMFLGPTGSADDRPEEMEGKVQQWLDENSRIRIVQILQTQQENIHLPWIAITIFYWDC